MTSRIMRIDASIANEIERLSKVLEIDKVQASRLLFLGLNNKKWGRPSNQSIWNKNFKRARIDYGRKRVKKELINVL